MSIGDGPECSLSAAFRDIPTQVSSAAPTAAPAAASFAFAAVLRESSYRRLWLSGLCVNSARWMDLVLLGWLAFQLTDSAFMVGLAAFARSAPLMVLGPLGLHRHPAGWHALDRPPLGWDRRARGHGAERDGRAARHAPGGLAAGAPGPRLSGIDRVCEVP